MPVPIIVYEDHGWRKLLPLCYIRPAFGLVCGMETFLGRVRSLLAGRSTALSVWCRAYLAEFVGEQTALPVNQPLGDGGALLLNGRAVWSALPDARPAEGAWVGVAGPHVRIACIRADAALAQKLTPDVLQDEVWLRTVLADVPRRDVGEQARVLDHTWEIVLAQKETLAIDWRRLPEESRTAKLGRVYDGSHVLAPENVHIGEGTRVKPCVVIDAEDGPVYIGRDVRIQPHSYIQGPCVIGDGTLIQPGATVGDGSYIGPVCKVGGEIEACIIQGYSNKQHDGFMGHSYVGSWVNIAADCISSDLKNTYGTVRVPVNGYEVESGEMFVGCVIGDHSKLGINVSIPTGAVIGFCSSVFNNRSPKFVNSFTWMQGRGFERYDPQRALAVTRKVMARRKIAMSPAEEKVFLGILTQALAIERLADLDGD